MTIHKNPRLGILLVDDEQAFLRSLSISLERHGINNLYQCQDSRQAISMIVEHNISIVVLDLTMPYLSGEQLLQQLVEQHPEVCVIVLSGLNQVETAVNCIRNGAFDYFVKTTEQHRLIEGINRAIQMQEMRNENQSIRNKLFSSQLDHPEAFASIITQDKRMHSVFQYLESVSLSNEPLLIYGESGVGKEQIASAVHTLSKRQGSLVCVNVAGLDDTVFSDTLFGHTKGAFTGANNTRQGLLEQASGGTILLDEIGDLSASSQIKLLRLLQEGEYYPLGSDRPKRSQARILVATHQNLEEKQSANLFRKDLYYRLRTHYVEIPALRYRKQDIPILLDHFLAAAAKELNKTKPTIPKELPVLLENYNFPGNIRELRGLVYDAMSLHKSKILSMDSFRNAINRTGFAYTVDGNDNNESKSDNLFQEQSPLPTLQEMSAMLVEEAMRRAKGNQSIASGLLGISQPALSKRLKKQNT